MGNKEIICKHKVQISACPFGCEVSPQKPEIESKPIQNENREVKIATVLSVPDKIEPEPIPAQPEPIATQGENVETTVQKQQKKVVGKPFPKGVSGNPKGRPKGQNYKTVFFQALKTLRDSKGRKITEHDVIKAGIMPMLKHISEGDPRFHNQYKDILDRIYGRPQQNIDLKNNGGDFKPPVTIIGMKFIKETKE
jgi:hypothetical protein